eukprot:353532-Chlamydomonas_euryale.AAC.12
MHVAESQSAFLAEAKRCTPQMQSCWQSGCLLRSASWQRRRCLRINRSLQVLLLAELRSFLFSAVLLASHSGWKLHNSNMHCPV